jgi:DNA helicase HerA-like ATPase
MIQPPAPDASKPVHAKGVGYVIAMEGSKLMAALTQPEEAGERGAPLEGLQIGTIIKVPSRRGFVFGLVTALSMREAGIDRARDEYRIAKIDLLGEAVVAEGGKLRFQRGVSIYPSLWAPVQVASNEDLSQIYARPNEPCIRIGAIHQDVSIPAYMLVDKLLGMHFAVLGTTGTGKSCALALLLRTILKSFPHGRILLLDPHNEYAAAFPDQAEKLNTGNLTLPYWLFNSEELRGILIDERSETCEQETTALYDAVLFARQKYHADSDYPPGTLTIDAPVPYQMRDVLFYLNERAGSLDRPDGAAPFLRLKERILHLKSDPRYHFIFPPLKIEDTMAAILGRLMRLPVDSKPITVLNLSGVPSEIVDVVVSVIGRLVFDFAVWSASAGSPPILLVCEEAHRYLPRDPSAGFGPTRQLFARIAQEGRKYGIGLGLVTQRPALISETILSQCNTLISLRMSNDTDQDVIRKAVPEAAFGLMGALPALKRQEAIVSGEGVTLPMRIRFADLPDALRPCSETRPFSQEWKHDDWNTELVHDVVRMWRLQHRTG